MTKLPSTWSWSTLGEECDLYQPKTISKEKMITGGSYEVYGANGVIGMYNEYNHEDSEVLLSCRGNCGTVNVSKPKSWINGNAMVCRPKTSALLKKYLRYYLESVNFAKVITGTAQQQITREPLSKVEIAMPPINEQHKIVELLEDQLSRLDAALADVKQAKIKAAQFRRSLLQAAFSDEFTEVGGRAKGNWGINKLGDLCTFITDGSHNPPKGIEKSDYLMLSSRDINNGKLTFNKPRYLNRKDFESENKRTDLQIDDVLLTTVGTIGRTAIFSGVPKNVTFQRSVSVLRPDKQRISSKFLMYFLDSVTELLNREARGVAQQGIYLNQVRKLEIPVPSFDEQRIIVELLDNHLSRLETWVALADLMEKQTSGLRRSLLQAAFTGQLTKEVSRV